jgi:hypothetical protein
MKSMSGLRKNQEGIVSILVTMIMILVISLIVLGFAQVSRRNERETLDSQLSTQAYYAAESGVDAAVNYLTGPSAPPIGTTIDTVGQCGTFINTLKSTVSPTVNILDGNSNTRYTCLMVDTAPSTLTVSPLTQSSSTILHLANPETQPFNALKFDWTQQQGSPAGPCTASGAAGVTLPTYDKWNCPYGILRLDLTDTDATVNHVDNTDLDNNNYTTSFYFIPSFLVGSSFKTAVNVTWPPAVQEVDPTSPAVACNPASAGNNCPVQIIPVHCTAAASGGDCSIELDFPGADTGTNGSKDIFARLSTMYQDTNNLTITGGDKKYPLPGGTTFIGGQALIDSTGQAQDELRRIQVRIPLTASSSAIPAYGLQTTNSICKQFTANPPGNVTDKCIPPNP